MLELVGSLVFYLIFQPAWFLLQAIVGVLAAGDSPRDRRDRNLAIAMMLFGVAVIAIGLLFPMPNHIWTLVCIAVGFASLGGASSVGYSLERRLKSPAKDEERES